MLQPFEIMWQQKVMQRCVALKIVVANVSRVTSPLMILWKVCQAFKLANEIHPKESC